MTINDYTAIYTKWKGSITPLQEVKDLSPKTLLTFFHNKLEKRMLADFGQKNAEVYMHSLRAIPFFLLSQLTSVPIGIPLNLALISYIQLNTNQNAKGNSNRVKILNSFATGLLFSAALSLTKNVTLQSSIKAGIDLSLSALSLMLANQDTQEVKKGLKT